MGDCIRVPKVRVSRGGTPPRHRGDGFSRLGSLGGGSLGGVSAHEREIHRVEVEVGDLLEEPARLRLVSSALLGEAQLIPREKRCDIQGIDLSYIHGRWRI